MSRGSAATKNRDIYSVSRLTREARDILEGSFPLIWIEGEISNLARPASGHLYFSLKDDRSQVRCAMFRGRNAHLGFPPENGIQVLVRAKVGLYEARGEFQLVVESMEEAGHGALQRQFEALKRRLADEGLFDPAHKREVPELPRCIGVVTSPSGAAIRDILSVLERRLPSIEVIIYPVPVQGGDAAARIASAIATADRRRECDVLIVGRGGGSMEDLWAFNEEVVARAIHACELPVVSAVGHEIDFTIADFVADVRAPTPSAAAELLSPDREELALHVTRLRNRLGEIQGRLMTGSGEKLAWLLRHLRQFHPGARLDQQMQRLDELQQRLGGGIYRKLRDDASRLKECRARLHRRAPSQRLETVRARLDMLDGQLRRAVRHAIEHRRGQMGALNRALDAISPLATLDRGYAIVSRDRDARILRHADQVAIGERVSARLAGGTLRCKVEKLETPADAPGD